MKTIYTVTGVYSESFKSSNTSTRCFGWYSSLEEAKESLNKNPNVISEEGYYEYVIIEEYETGLHPLCIDGVWYKWNDNSKKYIPSMKPLIFEKVCNFGLG
jgi:hypothetical protein